jgi:hypothetical protein
MSKSKQPKQRLAEKTEVSPPATNRPISSIPFLWIGFALLVIAFIARLRLLDIPFERDEGVFTYNGRAFMGGAIYTHTCTTTSCQDFT